MSPDSKTIDLAAIPIAPAGKVPNNPRFPLLHYRGGFDTSSPDLATRFESLFGANGWTNGWRNGVYPYTHWHCSAHEVLGVYAGSADVQVGGENGSVVTIEAGDVVIVPAGVAHKRLDDRPHLGIVGAYPDGQSPDLCQGDESLESALQRVGAVAAPKNDPIFGEAGLLQQYWV